MGEFSMVYYNNLLSLGPIALLVLGFGEHRRLPFEPALSNPEFLVVVGVLTGAPQSTHPRWLPHPATGSNAEHSIVVSCHVATLIVFQISS
jgi:GDP-mannose transporter